MCEEGKVFFSEVCAKRVYSERGVRWRHFFVGDECVGDEFFADEECMGDKCLVGEECARRRLGGGDECFERGVSAEVSVL